VVEEKFFEKLSRQTERHDFLIELCIMNLSTDRLFV